MGRHGECWLVHLWGAWRRYEMVRRARVVGPSLRLHTGVVQTWRRRPCRRSGEFDERLVAERPYTATSGVRRATEHRRAGR